MAPGPGQKKLAVSADFWRAAGLRKSARVQLWSKSAETELTFLE